MTVDELNKKLDSVLDDFASQIKGEYSESSQVIAKEQDIEILAHQFFETMLDFKNSIIEYLDQAK